MKGKAVSFGLPYLAAIAGAAGYFFRAAQRAGGSAVPVIAFSVLMCLLFLLGAATLEKREAYADVYRKLPSDAALSILGALAVAAGCVLAFSGAGRFSMMLNARLHLVIETLLDFLLRERLPTAFNGGVIVDNAALRSRLLRLVLFDSERDNYGNDHQDGQRNEADVNGTEFHFPFVHG